MIKLAELHKSGARPRVHGNGFIQLDLDEDRRLHIWGHRLIPQQKVCTPIHDHVFGFESEVLVGRILNVIYNIDPCDIAVADYRIYEPTIRQGEDTVLGPTEDFCNIDISHGMVYNAHEGYSVEPFEFHETFVSEPTATIITKDAPTLAQGAAAKPRVLVRRGQKPDNDFNRYDCMEPWMAWFAIKEVLGNLCDL